MAVVHPRHLAVPTLLLAAMLASGVVAEAGPTSSPIDPLASSEPSSVSGTGCGMEAALADLPGMVDEAEPFQVSVADLGAATELAGLRRPAGASVEDTTRWLLPLMGVPGPDDPPPPVYVYGAESLGMGNLTQVDEFDAELGWSVVDVDRYVEFAAPPRRFAVMEGDFGAELDAAGLETGPGGIVTAGDGPELAVDTEQITAARPLGAPLYMALRDGRLATSTTAAPLTPWLEGTGRTLADDDALGDVAGALDAFGCVSAFVSRDDFKPAARPQPIPPQLQAELDAEVRWEPFDTVGIGWAADGDRSVVAVVYAFADEEAAAASVEGLEAMWTDGTSFVTNTAFGEYVAVEGAAASGRVVTVRLRPADNALAPFPLDALFNRDVPFLSPPPTG